MIKYSFSQKIKESKNILNYINNLDYLKNLKIDGNFEKGSIGTVGIENLENKKITIIDFLDKKISFEIELILGKIFLNFEIYEEENGEKFFENSFELKGFSKYFYSFIIGNKISKKIPENIKNF